MRVHDAIAEYIEATRRLEAAVNAARLEISVAQRAMADAKDEIVRIASASDSAAPNFIAAPVRAIVADVADECGVSRDLIMGPLRSRAASIPRQEVMRRAIEAGISASDIARVLRRDHTTVIHGARRARERAQE